MKPTYRGIFKTLRDAGFVRAGRYSIWGRSVEGWMVIPPFGEANKADVLDTLCRSGEYAHRSHLMEYATALTAVGYTVTGTNRGSALEVSW